MASSDEMVRRFQQRRRKPPRSQYYVSQGRAVERAANTQRQQANVARSQRVKRLEEAQAQGRAQRKRQIKALKGAARKAARKINPFD